MAHKALVDKVFGSKGGYRRLKNPGQGDCLYHSIRQATGRSIKSLRKMVADNITKEQFELKKAAGDIGRLVTFDLYKKWVKETCRIWGDDLAVGILERKLGIRFLILWRERNMPYCRAQGQAFKPKKYIIIAYHDQTHYELVSYKGKRLLSRADLPDELVRAFRDSCAILKGAPKRPKAKRPATKRPVVAKRPVPATWPAAKRSLYRRRKTDLLAMSNKTVRKQVRAKEQKGKRVLKKDLVNLIAAKDKKLYRTTEKAVAARKRPTCVKGSRCGNSCIYHKKRCWVGKAK